MITKDSDNCVVEVRGAYHAIYVLWMAELEKCDYPEHWIPQDHKQVPDARYLPRIYSV